MGLKEESVIQEEEAKERQRFNELLILIAPMLFGISSVSTFTGVRRDYDKAVDQYIKGYGQRIKQEIFDAVKKIDPKLNAQAYVKEAFAHQYKIKGTNATIDLNEILLRRGLKVKGDITAEVIRKTGFSTPSQNIVNEIKAAVLKKNKESMAQLVGNEMHKARETAKIEKMIKKGVGARKKVFVYNTQGDERVRPRHSAMAEQELTITQAEYAKSSLLSDIGCRCYLTEM